MRAGTLVWLFPSRGLINTRASSLTATCPSSLSRESVCAWRVVEVLVRACAYCRSCLTYPRRSGRDFFRLRYLKMRFCKGKKISRARAKRFTFASVLTLFFNFYRVYNKRAHIHTQASITISRQQFKSASDFIGEKRRDRRRVKRENGLSPPRSPERSILHTGISLSPFLAATGGFADIKVPHLVY